MEWMFMPLKRYAEFSGRSRRMEFWLYMLGLFILYFVLMIIAVIMGVGAAASMAGGDSSAGAGLVGMMAGMGIMLVVVGIVALALFIPTLAVQIRRLHDSNRAGWWVWLYWGPYLISVALTVLGAAANSPELSVISLIFSVLSWMGSIALIVFWCLPGTPGQNRYGPDPLGGGFNDLSQTFR